MYRFRDERGFTGYNVEGSKVGFWGCVFIFLKITNFG